MTDQDKSPGAAIERFLKMVDEGDVHIFTPEDVAKLKELAGEKPALEELVRIHKRSPGALKAWVWWYDTLNGIAVIGGGLQRILMYLMFIAGVWVLAKDWIVSAIVKVASK